MAKPIFRDDFTRGNLCISVKEKEAFSVGNSVLYVYKQGSSFRVVINAPKEDKVLRKEKALEKFGADSDDSSITDRN